MASQRQRVDQRERVLQELQAVARRAPGSIDMRAALAALLWAAGEEEKAEELWGWACSKINSGQLVEGGPVLDSCNKYADDDWLRRIRRWPPVMVRACGRLTCITASIPLSLRSLRTASSGDSRSFCMRQAVLSNEASNSCGSDLCRAPQTKSTLASQPAPRHAGEADGRLLELTGADAASNNLEIVMGPGVTVSSRLAGPAQNQATARL